MQRREDGLYLSSLFVPIYTDAIWTGESATTIQREVSDIFSFVKWQSALVYLADIAVFSKTVVQYLNDLHHVLTLLRNAGVAVKFEICSFPAK